MDKWKSRVVYYIFFFNDTATTEIYTLSLHDALPIFLPLSPPSLSPLPLSLPSLSLSPSLVVDSWQYDA